MTEKTHKPVEENLDKLISFFWEEIKASELKVEQMKRHIVLTKGLLEYARLARVSFLALKDNLEVEQVKVDNLRDTIERQDATQP